MWTAVDSSLEMDMFNKSWTMIKISWRSNELRRWKEDFKNENLQLLFSLLCLTCKVEWPQEYQHNKEQVDHHQVSQTH